MKHSELKSQFDQLAHEIEIANLNGNIPQEVIDKLEQLGRSIDGVSETSIKKIDLATIDDGDINFEFQISDQFVAYKYQLPSTVAGGSLSIHNVATRFFKAFGLPCGEGEMVLEKE